MSPLRVHLCIDHPFAEEQTSGLVKTWARLLPEAARHPDLDVSVHVIGEPGRTRSLAANVRLHEHPIPAPTTEWVERLGVRVPVRAGLLPFQAELASAIGRADVLHTTYTMTSFALTAAAVARWRGIPLVHSHQTQVPQHAEAYVRDAIGRLLGGRAHGAIVARSIRRLLERQARWYFRQCSRILVSAPCDYAKLPADYPADRVTYLGRGIDTSAFHPARRDRALLRARFGISEDEPVILFVGKLMPDKNVLTLAHALAELAAEGQRFTLLLCGDGAQLRDVQALLGPRVIAAGVQRHDTLPWIYASADLFAFPSTAEVYGNVVVEAMCSGLPAVVSAREGSCQHISRPGHEGVIVDDDHPSTWARALRDLLRDPEPRRRIGAAARARVEASAMDWSAIFDRTVKPCWLAAAQDARGRGLVQRARSLAFGAIVLLAATATLAACRPQVSGRFADRPVAWTEQDEAPVATKPASNPELPESKAFRYFVAGTDKTFALADIRPAQDVNALDEVPRSTWYVPRNHLHRLSPEEVFAGPPWSAPPVPPFSIVEGKDSGKSPGVFVRDAQGRKYALKFDVAPHTGLMTGAEAVTSRLVYASGYYVPGSYVLDVDPSELSIAPGAMYRKHGDQLRRYTPKILAELLDHVARTPDGKLRAVAVAWVEGDPIGPFDMMGTRCDDPNDRIRHEHRRSLRATYVIMGWLNVADLGTINTLDTYVTDGRRRFVRHYFIDFGESLGSASTQPKDLPVGREYSVDLVRGARALVSIGLYRRAWQDDRSAYLRDVIRYPEVGYVPAEDWDPREYHTYGPLPPHFWMTDRDAYWGAKVVTSFTDDQIQAAVQAGHYSPPAAAQLARVLAIRRDQIARRYLVPMTAVEDPVVEPDAQTLCFHDLAIARGYLRRDATYRIDVRDDGVRVLRAVVPASRERTCMRLPAVQGRPYRTVTVRTRFANRTAKAARVHLAWRGSENRYVVVGLERDE